MPSTECPNVVSAETFPLAGDTERIEETVHGVLYGVENFVDNTLEFANNWCVRG